MKGPGNCDLKGAVAAGLFRRVGVEKKEELGRALGSGKENRILGITNAKPVANAAERKTGIRMFLAE